MKQDFNKGSTVVVYGDVDQRNFGLALGNNIFYILSDKLYANKVLAPIRELICNARDAHVAAGTEDRKFIVHLPTDSEPYFSVRDFGTGLTHQEVLDLYTVYGMTTKDASNKEIGCWGLGSKSPFAYTSRFEVYAYKDGMLNVYECMLSEGAPTVTRFDTCETTEPNGLEVRFDVKSDDFYRFRDNLKKLIFLQDYMEVIPSTYNFDSVPSRKGQIYTIVDKEAYKHCFDNPLSVEMGGVVYSVPYTYGQSSALNRFLRNVSSDRRAVIHAELGEVDVTISREQLDMTEKTYAFLENAVDKFMNSIVTQVKAEMAKEPDIMRKLLRYKQLFADYGSFTYIHEFDDKYRAMIRWMDENLSITTIEYRRNRGSLNTVISNAFRWFTSLASDVLYNKYPVFVDCSSKLTLPPEIRRAAKLTFVDLHCIRDKKTLEYLKRFNIPVHNLEEYKSYRPIRSKPESINRRKREPGELITSGLTTKGLNHGISDVEDSYRGGVKLYWCTSEELSAARLSAALLDNVVPKGLTRWYSLLPTMLSLMSDSDLSRRTVITTSKAAAKRAEEDPLFIHLPTLVASFIKSPAKMKRALNNFLTQEAFSHLSLYRSYGKDVCSLFYENIVEDDEGSASFLYPYAKRALLGKALNSKDSIDPVFKLILERQYLSAVCGYFGRFVGNVKDFVKDNFELAHAFLQGRGHEAPYWGYYHEMVEAELKDYLKSVVRRIRRIKKNKKED